MKVLSMYASDQGRDDEEVRAAPGTHIAAMAYRAET